MTSKPFIIGPPPAVSPTLESLRAERKNVPYVVVKYRNGNVSVWEREANGRVRCVHGGLKQSNDENSMVSRAFNCEAEVYYCNKQEAFFICL